MGVLGCENVYRYTYVAYDANENNILPRCGRMVPRDFASRKLPAIWAKRIQ